MVGARIVWDPATSATSPNFDRNRRITYALTDLLQTSSGVVDLVSGELLELSTYYPNGARENLWASDSNAPLEPMGFTGKEADEEIGLVYFGERWLMPRLGRWASPDPLHVHAMGGGEALNSYHYVSGNLLQARDPLGLDDGASPRDPDSEFVMNGTDPSGEGRDIQIWTAREGTTAPNALVIIPGRMGPDQRRRDAYICEGACKFGQEVHARMTLFDAVVSEWISRADSDPSTYDTLPNPLAIFGAVAAVFEHFTMEIQGARSDREANQLTAMRARAIVDALTVAAAVVLDQAIQAGTAPTAPSSAGAPEPVGPSVGAPEPATPFVPDEYWERHAPATVTPSGSPQRLHHVERSARTGRVEQSTVVCDEFGRQSHRVDHTDHMRPEDHSDPHLHESTYAPDGTRRHSRQTGRREERHILRRARIRTPE